MILKKALAALCAILCIVACVLPVMANDSGREYHVLKDTSDLSGLTEAERVAVSYIWHIDDCYVDDRNLDVLQGTFFELGEEEQTAILDAADSCTPYDFRDCMIPSGDFYRNTGGDLQEAYLGEWRNYTPREIILKYPQFAVNKCWYKHIVFFKDGSGLEFSDTVVEELWEYNGFVFVYVARMPARGGMHNMHTVCLYPHGDTYVVCSEFNFLADDERNPDTDPTQWKRIGSDYSIRYAPPEAPEQGIDATVQETTKPTLYEVSYTPLIKVPQDKLPSDQPAVPIDPWIAVSAVLLCVTAVLAVLLVRKRKHSVEQ